ncbi:putative inorganic phosphate cotransporter isoform X2 [Agrilus planipennis]|uniref:Putative inorganic phosphate cotransporter n=1 Tax=Agrilus planipennis TaxID=224129 RepID=A0A1W4XNN1_AGRPL|nr:putative inorganic phosphate cotransporter isoform X2 [Agrilus planipennis]
MVFHRFSKTITITKDSNGTGGLGYRHVQVVLLFFLISFGYAMRVCLSVGIVAMTDSSVNPDFPTYQWTDKSTILSSFFWGYVVAQVAAGIVIKKTGTQWLLFGSMFLSALTSVLIPVAASTGSWAVMVCRIFQGLAQGAFFPGCHVMLSKWAPPSERSILGTLTYAGNSFGTIISMPTTGWIANSNAGWPTAFYLFGALGFLWCIFWVIFGSESPAKHKSISEAEKNYIETSLGSSNIQIPFSEVPWLSILKSIPVWATFITACAHNWGFFTILTEMPLYLSGVHGFNISQNGLLSACPYLAMWIMSFVFGAMTDALINKKLVSVGIGRKIANTISQIGPGIALFLLGGIGYLGRGVAMALLIIGVALNGAHLSGFLVNLIDLSPTYAGVLMSFTNGTSQVCSIIAPLIVQLLVLDSSDSTQWAKVFYIAGGLFFFGNIVFVVFGSGEKQPWDSNKKGTRVD